jgi:hypothetical protein
MSLRRLMALGLVLGMSSLAVAQAPLGGTAPNQPSAPPPSNPLFGGPAPGTQPAAPPATNLGGDAPAAGKAPADPKAAAEVKPAAEGKADEKEAAPTSDQQYLAEMIAKNVVFKPVLKGKNASFWVAEKYAELTEADKTRLARAAFDSLSESDPKLKLTSLKIFLSDGKKLYGLLGLYSKTTKGETVKFSKPKAVAGPIGAGGLPDGGLVQPPIGAGVGNNFCPCF